MSFISEAQKIKPKIEKYLNGKILDIGAGNWPVVDTAKTVDYHREADYKLQYEDDIYKLDTIIGEKFDTIFASHVIEHLTDPHDFIETCGIMLRKTGKLILYIPDSKYYDNRSNFEHLQSYEYEVFLRWFEKTFNYLFIICEHGSDWDRPNCYSFYLVAER